MTNSTNLLDLPNRFVVLNSGATETPVVGVYDIPPDAPHSLANREYPVTMVESQQGIDSEVEAIAAAQALARSWQFPYETVEFAGPPDPRHDHYNVIELEGIRFLELSWSMSLVEGIPMRHVARRTYEATAAVETLSE